jgi:hypothetical protein
VPDAPDAPTGPPPGGLPWARRPDPEVLSRGFDAAADVILSLLNHVDELDTADLPVVDGRTVRIVALSEVEEWLTGCARRTRAGNIL